MHLIAEEAISILEINATKCHCLPVCPLKVKWCVLLMGGLMLLGNCCWCTCLISLQKFTTGVSKIYSTAQCESCSENFIWKGMLLGSLAVFQIGCQIVLLDLREFSCCLHFPGTLKSTWSFLCIKISTWHRAFTDIHEEIQSLMNLNHCKAGYSSTVVSAVSLSMIIMECIC